MTEFAANIFCPLYSGNIQRGAVFVCFKLAMPCWCVSNNISPWVPPLASLYQCGLPGLMVKVCVDLGCQSPILNFWGSNSSMLALLAEPSKMNSLMSFPVAGPF